MSGLWCETLGDGDPDYDPDGWWYTPPDDYQTAPDWPRRKRCCSCRALIDRGALCARIGRWRYSRGDVEERIHGEMAEIQIASWWWCEECADCAFTLREWGVGFLIGDGETTREKLREAVYEYFPDNKPMRISDENR